MGGALRRCSARRAGWIARAAAALCLALLAAAGPACAGKLALVIGNATYGTGGTLDNPVNDATAVADRLRALHYDVAVGRDLNYEALRRAVSKFMGAIHGGDTVIIYYAGHGVEFDGRDYLLPVDAPELTPENIRTEGFPLDNLLLSSDASRDVNMVIFFDACRDNNFIEKIHGRLAGTSRFDLPLGTEIMFSASQGKAALDDDPSDPGASDRHSVFAKALINGLFTADDMDDLLRAIRSEVTRKTQARQLPQKYGDLNEKVFLNSEQAVASRSGPGTGDGPPPTDAFPSSGGPIAADPGGGTGELRHQQPPGPSFCDNLPPGAARRASDPRACPDSSGPSISNTSGYVNGAPSADYPQRPIEASVPYAGPQLTSSAPFWTQPGPFPVERLGEAPRSSAHPAGGLTIASLGRGLLPQRPILKPVPPIQVPERFCGVKGLNDFFAQTYQPAYQIAFNNNDVARAYIHDLEGLRREYAGANDTFAAVVVAESQDYKQVAQDQFDTSNRYFHMDADLRKVPQVGC